MKFNWNYPTTVWVGKNRIDDLPNACESLKVVNPLLVTDKDLIELPFIKNIISNLKKKFSQFNIFSNFTGNPIGENIISFLSTLPTEFDLHRYIDYEMQFEKAFLDPLSFISQSIGWQLEKVASLEDFFG